MEADLYDVLLFGASDRMWRGKSLAAIDPMVRNILFAKPSAEQHPTGLGPRFPGR
jgi:hypothetical protein